MSLRFALPFSRAGRLALLGAFAVGALLLLQAAFTRAAHADEPGQGGVQQNIIVPPGGGGGGQLSIHTDRSWYHFGDPIRICYSVPTAGYMQILDQQGGSQHIIRSGYDNGYGDCFYGYVTPPAGFECLRLTFWFPWGGSDTRTTCFSVYSWFPPF
jgi:hypothetical protein